MDEVRSHGPSLVQSDGLEIPLAGPAPAMTSEDVDEAVRAWDKDIIEAARIVARVVGGSLDDAEDFAQAARLSLAAAVARGLSSAARYRRRIIKNAAFGAARRERYALRSLSSSRVGIEEQLAAPDDSQMTTSSGVADWIATLPRALQDIYELLYLQGHTQREAAALLHMTQPRISQLHTELKRRGREEFLAA